MPSYKEDLLFTQAGYNVGSAAAAPNVFTQLETFTGATSGTTQLQASAIASGVLTLPAATDTLIGKATVDTMLNKTLTSPTITGTISGTPGIVGVTTNSNAAAGNVGELLSTVQSATQSLTNTTILNLNSISLTAGDWDVQAIASFGISVAATYLRTGIHTANNAYGLAYDGSTCLLQASAANLSTSIISTAAFRVSLAGTTTYYQNVDAQFASGTATASGTIRARRVR